MNFKVGALVRIKPISSHAHRHLGIGVIETFRGYSVSCDVRFSDGLCSEHTPEYLELVDEKTALVIEGNEIKLSSQTRPERQVSIPDFFSTVKSVLQSDILATPILPQGTILYEQRGEYEAILLEEQPSTRYIKWSDSSNMTEAVRSHQIYQLAFPYVIIGFATKSQYLCLGSPHVFFRTEPISSKQDQLYATSLLNVCTDGCVCLGFETGVAVENIAKAAKIIREAFWHRIFTWNWTASYKMFAPKTVGTVDMWEKRSKEDPFFVLHLQWPATPYTVETFMELLIGKAERRRFELKTFDDVYSAFLQTPETKEEPGWVG